MRALLRATLFICVKHLPVQQFVSIRNRICIGALLFCHLRPHTVLGFKIIHWLSHRFKLVLLIFTPVGFLVSLSHHLIQLVGSIGALVQRQRAPTFDRALAVSTMQFATEPAFQNIATNTISALAMPHTCHRWSHLASGAQHRCVGTAACSAELVPARLPMETAPVWFRNPPWEPAPVWFPWQPDFFRNLPMETAPVWFPSGRSHGKNSAPKSTPFDLVELESRSES